MTLAELDTWICSNFVVKQGEQKAYYETLVTPGDSATGQEPVYHRHVYEAHTYSVRDRSDAEAEYILCRKMQKVLEDMRWHCDTSHLPTLTVRASLAITKGEYLEFGSQFIPNDDVKEGRAVRPAGWEIDFDTDNWRPVTKRGVYRKIHFRFCVEGCTLPHTAQPDGTVISLDSGLTDPWQCHGGLFDPGSQHLNGVTDPDHCHGLIYGTQQSNADPGHSHSIFDPGQCHSQVIDAMAANQMGLGQPVIFGYRPAIAKSMQDLARDIRASKDLVPPEMTEARYAEIVAMQDAPKPSRYEQKRQLQLVKEFDESLPVPVKPAPNGIIGWI